ncbi:MAG: VanW family protein [Eubacteriales bacterium]|nr:VanW family protein [Eubacteriales bacterium]
MRGRQSRASRRGKTKKVQRTREKRALVLTFCALLLCIAGVYLAYKTQYRSLEKQNVLRKVSANEEETKRALEKNTVSETSAVFAKGLVIAGVNIAELDIAEAVAEIEAQLNKLNSSKLKLYHNDESLELPVEELDLKLDLDELKILLDEVLNDNRKAFKLPITINEQVKLEIAKKVAENFERDPVNAYYGEREASGKLKINPEKTGYELNEDTFFRNLEDELSQNLKLRKFAVPLKEIEAEVTASDLSAEYVFLASAYTNVPYYDANRIHNLVLSCEKINGTIVSPGQIFSFMTAMGNFGPADGWANAGMQADGIDTAGLGGGICQTSTTLFQASVLAGLDIIEAHNHDLPSDYCKQGTDAMVAYGWADLRIQNNLSGPIKIIAYFSNPSVIFEIYGPAREPGVVTELYVEESEGDEPGPTETKISADLAKGETSIFRKERSGKKTSLYRLWLQNGQVIRKDLIVHYSYPAFSEIKVISKADEEKETKESESKESSRDKYDYDWPKESSRPSKSPDYDYDLP